MKKNISEEKVNEYSDQLSKIMKKKLILKEVLIKDTVDFIKCNYKKYNMSIASGSEEKELNYLCEQLEIKKYFRGIYGAPLHKNDIVKNIIKNNNYNLEETILIGDSINDFDAAKVNNIGFYGFNNESLKNINELSKDLNKIIDSKNIIEGYSNEMENIFKTCFNKEIQKLITDSKLKKLEKQRLEIEQEKCSFFSKLLGKAKLKQAKLDNINLKKQLILSESQYINKSYYYLEDGLSEVYTYLKEETDETCLSDIRLFLRNIEQNSQIKNMINQDKLNNLVKEKMEQKRNLPQLVLSKEKHKLFSKAQINLMEEKNNELKRVIQITRANSLKLQNTGMIPILGNIKTTKSISKFCNNLNEINNTLKYQNQ